MSAEMPERAMREVMRVLEGGDRKYGVETRYDGSAKRHYEGAERHAARRILSRTWDRESGLRTTAHEIARLLLALEIELRPPTTVVPQSRDCDG